MEIINNSGKKTLVVLNALNGYLDQDGRLHSNCKSMEWNLVSSQGGIDHYIKTNRYNSLRAKYKFINNTNSDVVFKWAINIITNSGQNLKYDFGTINIKANATVFSIGVPYNFSRKLFSGGISHIMVALIIV